MTARGSRTRLFVLLGHLWRLSPAWARALVLKLTQDRFTIGVCALLADGSGHLLLLRDRFHDPEEWRPVCGFLKAGETPESGLLREVREETGYVAEIQTLIGADMERPGHLNLTYLCTVAGGELQLDSSEIIEARLFAPTELPPSMLAMYRRFAEQARHMLR